MGPCISNIFPCLTQFGQKLDLGPCFIQVFNYSNIIQVRIFMYVKKDKKKKSIKVQINVIIRANIYIEMNNAEKHGRAWEKTI